MTQAHERLDPDDWPDDEQPLQMSNLFRALGVLAALAMVIYWIYVFTNVDSISHPDEFDDPPWTELAESLCDTHQQAILALPNAGSVDTPAERGELVALGTSELEAMIAGLGSLGPPDDPKGAEIVPQWLDDYELYLQDRRDWTGQLLAGQDPPFVISGNAQGVRVTDLLTTFAEVNEMPSCAPSPDVG